MKLVATYYNGANPCLGGPFFNFFLPMRNVFFQLSRVLFLARRRFRIGFRPISFFLPSPSTLTTFGWQELFGEGLVCFTIFGICFFYVNTQLTKTRREFFIRQHLIMTILLSTFCNLCRGAHALNMLFVKRQIVSILIYAYFRVSRTSFSLTMSLHFVSTECQLPFSFSIALLSTRSFPWTRPLSTFQF